jgi:hypothetical protein
MTLFFKDPKFKPVYQKIMDLNDLVWEKKLDTMIIDQWLDNFHTKTEQYLMLELLSKFTYYNENEIKSLLVSAYGRLKNHILFLALKNQTDLGDLDDFIKNNCYFVGTWENPSKSGTHLLYNFRLLNRLPSSIFYATVKDVPYTAKFVIFLDDIAGSGRQARDFWKDRVINESQHLTTTQFLYLVLVGSTKGVNYIEQKTKIKVLPIVELDERYNLFSDSSIYYTDNKKKQQVKKICDSYGKKLYSTASLGYDNSQLLIGFHHNVPDNTLPIIWTNKNGWNPIFQRNEGDA